MLFYLGDLEYKDFNCVYRVRYLRLDELWCYIFVFFEFFDIFRYEYEPGFASQLNRNSESSDTGVIAQEVAEILPEAVSPAGDVILENGTSIDNFLVVNKVGAKKLLCLICVWNFLKVSFAIL